MSCGRLQTITPEWAFTWLAACFGVAFAIATPPLQVPDEQRHLARAYLIAEGRLLAERTPAGARASLPRSLVKMNVRLGADVAHHPDVKQPVWKVWRELSHRLDPQDTLSVTPPSLYSPVAYLPQALAVAVARPLGLAPVIFLYLGRLLNLCAWIALVRLGLRRAPAQRWMLVVLALAPMSLFLAASASPDAVTNGLAFLFIASVLASRGVRGRAFALREAALLAGLAALVGLAKPVYWPLVLLILLIPGERFRSRGRRAACVALCAVASGLPALLWSLLVGRLDAPPVSPGADPAGQIQYLVAHPLAAPQLLLATLSAALVPWIESFVGVLGYLDTRLPTWVYVAHPCVLLAVTWLDDGGGRPLGWFARLVLLGTAAACWTATLLAAYVGWNPVGGDVIHGVQGRYFVPFAPLLPLALLRGRSRGLRAGLPAAVTGFCAAVLATALLCLVLRYYVG